MDIEEQINNLKKALKDKNYLKRQASWMMAKLKISQMKGGYNLYDKILEDSHKEWKKELAFLEHFQKQLPRLSKAHLEPQIKYLIKKVFKKLLLASPLIKRLKKQSILSPEEEQIIFINYYLLYCMHNLYDYSSFE